LLQGIKCKVTNTDVVAAMRDQHLLAVPAGDNVVRLIPPLTVTEDDIKEAVARLTTALDAMTQTMKRAG
ncbi:MAG: acetylornithine transaminase, partial [Pseudomonadota bacterium]